MFYISLTRACNFRCPCCPCVNHELSSHITFEKIVDVISKASVSGGVTLSGGEPTIHPDFIRVLDYLYQKTIPVTLLTNSSKLTDKVFIKKIVKAYPDIQNLSIITTLYNIDKNQHDSETGVPGSFDNSLRAINIWNELGANITLKHCITRRNFRDLRMFYEFIDQNVPQNVHFQLSGIDYVGMTPELRLSSKISCQEIRPVLDDMLEYIEYLKFIGKDTRVVYISSLPLCAASLKYKYYFVLNGNMGKIDYLSIEKSIKARPYDSRKGSSLCQKCSQFDDCPGTYSSAFEVMGDDFPVPFLEE